MFTIAALRARWHAFAGTFLALALGVALMGSTALVLLAAAPTVPARYAQASVLVRSPDPDADPTIPRRPWSQPEASALAARIARLDGVVAAVPDPSFYAQALIGGKPAGKPQGELDGHGFSTLALASFGLRSGHAPAGPGEVVADEVLGVRAGDPVTILTAAGPHRFTVSGTVDGPGEYPAGYWVSDAEAARLAGGVRVIGVRAAAGADVSAAVRQAVGDRGEVLSGDGLSKAEPVADAKLRWITTQILSAMAILAGFTTVFVVASTFAFGVHQRRREFALLRAVGATPSQVRRGVLAESAAISVLAGIAGTALAAAAAGPAGTLLARAHLARPDLAVPVSFLPLAAAALAGFAIAVAGVWLAARRASRVRPMEALRTAAAETRPMTWSRWIFGALAALFAAAMFVVTTRADGDSVFTDAILTALSLMTALALWGPAVMPPLVRIVCWPFSRTRGALPLLLRENTSAAARRVASTVAPVLLTVGFTVLILGSLGSIVDATSIEEAGNARVGVAVTALDGAPGLTAAAVEAIPGRSASGLSTDVYASDGRVRALGVSPQALASYGDGLAVKAGDLRRLTGSTVAVSAERAAEHHWRIGDAVPFTFADGRTLPLTVVALVPPGAIPEPVLLPPDLVRAHDPNAMTGVAFTDGPVASADRAVHSLGARAQTVRDWAASGDGEIELLRIFMLLLVVTSAGYSAVAVGNTLLMATLDRGPEFALLRLAGATPAQVLRLVASETVLLVTTGTVLGTGIAVVALQSIRSGLAEQFGSGVALSIPWLTTAGVAGGCLVLALAASAGVAAFAQRSRTPARPGPRPGPRSGAQAGAAEAGAAKSRAAAR